MVGSQRRKLSYHWAVTRADEFPILEQAGVADCLISYQYVLREGIDLREIEYKFDSILLDSGGFTAMGRGHLEPFSIEEYGLYAKEMVENGIIRGAFNYDIGTDRSPEKEGENYSLLRDLAGPAVIPIFRGGSDPRWLDHYVESGARAIGVSGLSGGFASQSGGINRAAIQIRPYHRAVSFHGLGVGNPRTVAAVGFSSVDSSTWARVASYAGARALGARGENTPELREPWRYGFRVHELEEKKGDSPQVRAEKRKARKFVAILNTIEIFKKAGIDITQRRSVG